MPWDNEDWAAKHTAKHRVTTEEAWEVAFENPGTILQAPDQLRYPPFRRYWTISKTKAGRVLIVFWERHRETKNLVTAFEPSQERIAVYERQKKKR